MKFHYNYINIFLFSLSLISCGTWHEVISYDLHSIENVGKVTKTDMTIAYDKFVTRYSPDGHIEVFNTTDSTMYIDMGESYCINKDGQATRLYSNAVTSQFNSGTSNVSVNLGSLAGAFGIGGLAGTIASGINVGGGNSSGTSIQTFEDRYISIPPKSHRPIKFVSLEVPCGEGSKGTQIQYDENSTPLAVGHHMTYTFNTDGKDWKNVRNIMYINEEAWLRNKKEFNAIPIDKDKSLVKRKGITRASVGGWLGGLACGIAGLIGILFAL